MSGANAVQIIISADGTLATKTIKDVAGATRDLNSSTTNLTETAKKLAAQAAAAFGLYQVAAAAKGLIAESAMLAARVETLAVVLETVGANTGKSKDEMRAYAEGVRAMGITTQESMQTVIRMSQANMDLSKSQELARIAQDAAVIGNINSSEALNRMIHGIQSNQVEILRTIGLNVNFEQSTIAAAKAMDKTVDQLTEAEKANIRMNAAMNAAQSIAGTYEAAMGTVGKQIGSLPRYIEEVKLKLGEMFTPALQALVTQFTNELKDLDKTLENMKKSGDMKAWGEDFAESARTVMKTLYALGIVIDRVGQGMAILAATFGFVRQGQEWFNTLQKRAEASHRAMDELAMSASGFRRATEEDMEGGLEGMARNVLSTGEVLYYIKQAVVKSAEGVKQLGGQATKTANDTRKLADEAKKFAEELKKAQAALDNMAFSASLSDPALSDLDKAFMQLDRTAAEFKEQYSAFPQLFTQVDAIIAQGKGYVMLDIQLKQATEAAEKLRTAYFAREAFERELTDKSLSEIDRRIAAEDKWLADMRIKALEFVRTVEEFNAIDLQLTEETTRRKLEIHREYVEKLQELESQSRNQGVSAGQQSINSLMQNNQHAGGASQGLGQIGEGMGILAFEQIQYQQRLEALQKFYADKQALLLQAGAEEHAIIQAQHEQTLAQEALTQNMQYQNAIANVMLIQGVLNLAAAFTGKHNTALFLMQKAAAIAMTIIHAHAAAAAAVAPPPMGLGPILGPPVAAKLLAFGYLQAAAIAATTIGQLSAGGKGGSVPTPGSRKKADLQEEKTAEPAPVQHRSQAVNVYIYGHVIDHDKFARETLPAIQKALGDNA